jgi:hypothetical protein
MGWEWIIFSVGVTVLFLGIVSRWVFRVTDDEDEKDE